jgi:general secretion pathway protein C
MRLRIPVSRVASVLLFALLCAIVAYWTLQLVAHRAPVAPAGAVARTQAPLDLAQASRLFGGVPVASAAAGRSGDIRVTGVLAAGRQGIALLSVNGAPAKAFGVGQQVTEGVRVEAVEPDLVRLAQGDRMLEIEAPARGSVSLLTSGPSRSAPAAPPVPGAAPAPAAALPAFGAAAGVQSSPPPRLRPGMLPGGLPGPRSVPGADGGSNAAAPTIVAPTPTEPASPGQGMDSQGAPTPGS